MACAACFVQAEKLHQWFSVLGNKTVEGEQNIVQIEESGNENRMILEVKELSLRFYCTEFQLFMIADLKSYY